MSSILISSLPSIAEIAAETDDDLAFMSVLRKRKKSKNVKNTVIKTQRADNNKRARLRDEWSNLNNYQPDDFRDQFRLSKKSLALLEKLLAKPFAKLLKNRHTGRSNIPLRERLLLTLWTLSTQESFKQISERFSVAEGTAHNILMDTCHLLKELTRNYVTLPENFGTVAKDFKELHTNSFPGVVGIVNCLDIPILTPAEDKASYYNRTMSAYSVKMQAICDSRCQFLNIFIGYPGACHDTEMWKASKMFKLLSEKSVSLPRSQHLIAGPSYPLDTFLMTPYKEEETHDTRQKNYNEILMATQRISTKTFTLLQGRFRRLSYLHMSKIPEMKIVILAACILHNFILLHEDGAGDEHFVQIESIPPRSSSDADFFLDFDDEIHYEADLIQANVKRHTISNALLRKSQL